MPRVHVRGTCSKEELHAKAMEFARALAGVRAKWVGSPTHWRSYQVSRCISVPLDVAAAGLGEFCRAEGLGLEDCRRAMCYSVMVLGAAKIGQKPVLSPRVKLRCRPPSQDHMLHEIAAVSLGILFNVEYKITTRDSQK